MARMIFEPHTTEEILVQHAQELLMSRGYMSAIELAVELVKHLYKMGDEDEAIDIPKLISESIADGRNYHKVEYTNSVVSHRVKELF